MGGLNGFLGDFGSILYSVVLPILLLAGVGYLLQRRLGLDMPTLRTLSFHYVLPAVMFASIVTTELAAREVGVIVAFTLLLIATMGALTFGSAAILRVHSRRRSSLVMATTLQNTGNYGMTLQRLAFTAQGSGAEAMSLQAFVMLTQNIVAFTAGVVLASWNTQRSRGVLRSALAHMVRLPPLYAVVFGVVVAALRQVVGNESEMAAQLVYPFWQVILVVRDAFLGIAVLTLGAQLATIRVKERDLLVILSVVLRLIFSPLLAFFFIRLFGLQGFVARVLLIGTCNPTAVNCMLLCLQFDNHSDFAARAVFYSTLLSPLTVSLVVYAARSGLVG